MRDPLLLVLRAERLDRGLSMRQAGELIGNDTYASIYNWESEKTSPTLAQSAAVGGQSGLRRGAAPAR